MLCYFKPRFAVECRRFACDPPKYVILPVTFLQSAFKNSQPKPSDQFIPGLGSDKTEARWAKCKVRYWCVLAKAACSGSTQLPCEVVNMVIPDAAVVVPPVPPVAEDENGDHFHAQALPTVHAFPWRHTKVIHFIRHGEGYHNGALTDKVDS